MMYYHYGYGPSLGEMLWHLVGIVIAVAVIIWLVRMIFGRGRHSKGGARRPWWDNAGSGIEILNERYAKGEIDKEEYEERKKTLLG